MDDTLTLLIFIAKKTGFFSEHLFTTASAAKELCASQQTVSRKLRILEEQGYIERKVTPDGILVRLSDKGRAFISKAKNELESIIMHRSSLKGKVVSGLGEGRFYTSLPGYGRQFIEKLGIKPYPGTLNLKVDPSEAKEFLSSRNTILIDGFATAERTYGKIIAYPVEVNGTSSAILVPQRSHHPENIVEVIAPVDLRKRIDDEVVLQ